MEAGRLKNTCGWPTNFTCTLCTLTTPPTPHPSTHTFTHTDPRRLIYKETGKQSVEEAAWGNKTCHRGGEGKQRCLEEGLGQWRLPERGWLQASIPARVQNKARPVDQV